MLEAEERKKCIKNGNANYKKERGKTSEVKTDERANQGEQNHGITLVTFFHYGQIVVFKNVFDGACVHKNRREVFFVRTVHNIEKCRN